MLYNTTPASRVLYVDRPLEKLCDVPDWMRDTPAICHPSAAFRNTGFPSLPSARWPGPNGSSYTQLNFRACRMSKLDGVVYPSRLRSVSRLPVENECDQT